MNNKRLSDKDMRDAFIDHLVERALENEAVWFLSNDFGAPSLDRFRTLLPDRFLNMGIAEQNMVSVAAGLAMTGKRVFVYTIASFLLRCLEQIKLDVCVHKLPVTFLGVGPCYGYSEDGPTHHATEDLAILRPMTGLRIYSPGDSNAAERLVEITLQSPEPTYVRLDRGRLPLLPPYDPEGPGFRVLQGGPDVGRWLAATGLMVHTALETANELVRCGIQVGVLECYRLSSLDRGALAETLKGAEMVVVPEEHSRYGGLGSLVAETVAEAGLGIRVVCGGINSGQLYAYGKRDTLHSERNLESQSLITILR